MSMIGAEGTNAYTSNDVTCYVDEIPSNQVENWVKIAADRFRNCVFRGFHTELEAVYEEKNMGMTNDGRKAIEKMDSLLFLRHPYGTQTVIGTQDHLKNPSLKAIRYQKDTYYVPNNMAICLSGDFDPDKMVALIEKYFGDWEPNKNLPKYNVIKEDPITTPRVKDVYGFESEFLLLAWRTPGAADKESEIADIAGEILNNGMAGLIDLDVMQRQKVLGAFVMPYERTDYGAFIMEGFAKQGQDLEEVKTILLEEIAKLRTGEFSDTLLTSVKNNVKLSQMRALERNSSRADMFVDSFINGTSWKDEVASMKNVDKITKAEVVAWAQKYLGPESYIAVYKRTGEDKTVKKIDAPKITPIVTNRDKQSGFLAEIAATEVEPIEPVFVDYQKDLEVRDYKGLELLYKENVKNDIASVSFRYDIGTDDLPLLGIASDYISYLGTPTRTADDIAKEMYALACNFRGFLQRNRVPAVPAECPAVIQRPVPGCLSDVGFQIFTLDTFQMMDDLCERFHKTVLHILPRPAVTEDSVNDRIDIPCVLLIQCLGTGIQIAPHERAQLMIRHSPPPSFFRKPMVLSY